MRTSWGIYQKKIISCLNLNQSFIISIRAYLFFSIWIKFPIIRCKQINLRMFKHDFFHNLNFVLTPNIILIASEN